MAEPKKETVRIALPQRPEQAASIPSVAKRDTARIVLPSRTPVTRRILIVNRLPAAVVAARPLAVRAKAFREILAFWGGPYGSD